MVGHGAQRPAAGGCAAEPTARPRDLHCRRLPARPCSQGLGRDPQRSREDASSPSPPALPPVARSSPHSPRARRGTTVNSMFLVAWGFHSSWKLPFEFCLCVAAVDGAEAESGGRGRHWVSFVQPCACAGGSQECRALIAPAVRFPLRGLDRGDHVQAQCSYCTHCVLLLYLERLLPPLMHSFLAFSVWGYILYVYVYVYVIDFLLALRNA